MKSFPLSICIIKPADIFHAVEIHRLIPNDSFLITFRVCVTLPWASDLFLCVPQIHSFGFGSFPPAEGSDLQMTFTQPFPEPPFINPTGLQLRAVWLHFTNFESKYGHDFAHLIFVLRISHTDAKRNALPCSLHIYAIQNIKWGFPETNMASNSLYANTIQLNMKAVVQV